MSRHFALPSPATLVVVIALIVALGGTASAAHFTSTRSSQVKPGALQVQNRGVAALPALTGQAFPVPRYHYRSGEELDYQMAVGSKSYPVTTCAACSPYEGTISAPTVIKITGTDTRGVARGMVTFDRDFTKPPFCCALKGHPTVPARLWPRGRITGLAPRLLSEIGGQGIWNLPARQILPGSQWVSHATGHFPAKTAWLYHAGLPLPTVIRHTCIGNRPASSGNGTDAVFTLAGVVNAAADVPNLPTGHDSISGSTSGEMRFNLTHGILDTARVHESMDLTRTYTTPNGTLRSSTVRVIFDLSLTLIYGRIPR